MSEQTEEHARRNEISAQLLKLQASALDRKNRIDSDLHRESGAIPADFSEQAVTVENDEALVAIQGELELQLSQIGSALGRLASGNYGLCEGCGGDISAARLEAIPAAALCIQCASVGE